MKSGDGVDDDDGSKSKVREPGALRRGRRGVPCGVTTGTAGVREGKGRMSTESKRTGVESRD